MIRDKRRETGIASLPGLSMLRLRLPFGAFFLGILAVAIFQRFRSEEIPVDSVSLHTLSSSTAMSDQLAGGKPLHDAASVPSSAVVAVVSSSSSASGFPDDTRRLADRSAPPAIESTARLHRAPAPVTPERRRWFQEIVAEQELRSADGESLVRQLVAAGLSAQDAEEAVRRYFIQVGGCVLDAIEARARKINESFEEFFAETERDLQDPSQARGLLFAVLEIEDQFDYCDLVASQAAGLR